MSKHPIALGRTAQGEAGRACAVRAVERVLAAEAAAAAAAAAAGAPTPASGGSPAPAAPAGEVEADAARGMDALTEFLAEAEFAVSGGPSVHSVHGGAEDEATEASAFFLLFLFFLHLPTGTPRRPVDGPRQMQAFIRSFSEQ